MNLNVGRVAAYCLRREGDTTLGHRFLRLVLSVEQAPGVDVRGKAGPRGGDDGQETVGIRRRPLLFKPLVDPVVEVLVYDIRPAIGS